MKSVSLQYRENVVEDVKGLTEVQIEDICSPPMHALIRDRCCLLTSS